MRTAARFRVLLLVLGLLAAARPLLAADGKKTAGRGPKVDVVGDSTGVRYTIVRRLPREITLAQLSNGLTVIVQENHAAPVATVRCFVKNTGSAYEGRYLGVGLSHVLEHVVAGGSTTRHSEKEIERIINTFGGATNAFTSNDVTVFFIDCPAKDTMTAIGLMADSMQHIIFEPTEFARELKVVRRELADGEVDRARVLQQLLGQTIYTIHPVRHPVIGYLDVLKRTTNQTIIDFYHQRYVPQNQIFVVVGDVRTQAVLDEVAKQWAATPRSAETLVAMPEEPEQLTPREAIREMDGSTYDMALAWPTVALDSKDMYPLDLAAYILAEGESSRLVRELKYERQLVLSVSAVSDTPHFVRGWFGVFAVSRPEHWKAASAAILQQVYRLCNELVDPAELARAKKQKAAERIFASQTVQQAAENLGQNYLSADDPLFDQAYVDEIQKVTPEQIREVARRYFVPQRLNRVIVAPPGGAPKEGQKEAAAVESPVRLVRLSNGLRVLVKRDSHLPLVNVQAFVLGATLADSPATAGRSALVAEMLDKGTPQHSAQQIAEYFDSIGGQFSMEGGRNTIYGTATVLREDFPRALGLFAECFTQPTFPGEEFQRVKQLALGAIARRADDAHGEIAEFFFDNLPSQSPYHLNEGGKADTIGRLTPEDLRAYHAKYFVPNNMIVTVFGDIDSDRVLDLVKRQFGPLRPDPKFEPVSFARPNAIPATITRHKQTGKPTGMIMLGYPEMSIRDRQDYAAMTVLQAILAGYRYPGGWLHGELRGQGLVYSVYATQLTGPAPGFFVIGAQTRPDKIEEVVQRIERNLERAKAGDIPDDEFRVAQQRVIALRAQENTTIASQARQAALDELYGLGYDYDRHFDKLLEAVTRDDVIRVARKYLNQHLLVTSSPEPAKKER